MKPLMSSKFARSVCPVMIGALLFFCASLFAAAQAAPKKVNPKDLSMKYQDWLKLTTYIITSKEKDVFLQLQNDRDRDLFIEAFWNHRDPTPGTPENEFKTEHLKRFQEASKRFRYGSTREGWQTDRGRIYIILGRPQSQTYYEGSTELYPAEIWSYYGDVNKGLPVHFQLMFYQWHNSGEMKLYDPVSDGPGRLIVNSQTMNPSDYEAMYEMIYDLQPDVALICLSIIPGEIPFGFKPSTQTPIYIANILDSPKKGLNESYATHFLNYRGVVSTEYLTNYIESETYVAVVQDPLTGAAFCDFVIAPKKLSVDLYEPKNEYSCLFQVDVSLRAGDKVVFQYSKDFPLTIPERQFAETQAMGICIADSFPVIEGKYHLTVLLRNATGKEFTTLEADLDVPSDSGRPRIIAPVVGYKVSDVPAGVHVPFQAGEKKMNVDPKYTYSSADQIALFFDITGLTEDLWKTGSVGILFKGNRVTNPHQKSLTVPLNAQGFRKTLKLIQVLPAAEFPPDYYDLTITLKDAKGKTVDENLTNFAISTQKTLSHPVIASKSSSLANSFIFFYALAYQYDQVNQDEKAEAMYKKAYSLNPAYQQKVPEYASFLLKVKKFDEALSLIETIKGDPKLNFQYFLTKGRALIGREKYQEAIQNLSEGNKIYNSDTVLLNALGMAYFRTGRMTEALNALNASLKLNPNQPEIKKLVQEIQGKK